MASISPESEGGHGATSLGSMVPLSGLRPLEEAERLATLLTERQIPALVQSQSTAFHGLLLPAAPEGKGYVIVPEAMLAQAVALTSWFDDSQDLWSSPSKPAPRPSQLELTQEVEILELPLPDSGPLVPRLALAGGSILFAASLQQLGTHLLGGHRELVRQFAASTLHVEQWWRLVSASFLHSSISHHFWNALFGLVLGVVLFGTHGFGATMLVWLLSSMTGIGAELLVSSSTTFVLGASAGNYGLIGLWAKGQLDRSRVSVLPKRERLKTLGVLLLLVPGALTPVSAFGARTAVFAHVAGFLAGFLLGHVFARRVRESELQEIGDRSRVAFALVTSVLVLALVSRVLFHAS